MEGEQIGGVDSQKCIFSFQSKPFHDEKVIRDRGTGWVDYMFPKPGQTQPSRKWSYVKAMKIDEATGLIGAGCYLE